MKISIILGHQHVGSFNHAIAEAARTTLEENGHTVTFHDLYAENFNPLLPHEEVAKGAELDPVIQAHCDEIAAADGIIIVHPNWWGQPPAILKGWVDRVMRQGVAYKFGVNDAGEGVPIGLLKANWALVFTTSNTPRDRETEWFGDPLENLWKNCILLYCGVKQVERTNYEVVIISTPEQRAEWLADVRQRVTKVFPA
jgi:putative NADPH-quinone reductase